MCQHSVAWMDGQCADVQMMENAKFATVCMHLIRLIGVIYVLILAFVWIKLVDECCSHHVICIMNHDNCWQIWWLTTSDSTIAFIFGSRFFYDLMFWCYGDSVLFSCEKNSTKEYKHKRIHWRKVHHHKKWFFLILKIK